MPKIVYMDKKVVKGITICNFLAGGRKTNDVLVWEDDILKDFSYLDGRIIRTLNGRLSNVSLAFSPAKVKNKYGIKDLASVNSIDVDISSCYHSNIVTVPKSSVLEYRAPEPKEEEEEENACICPYVEASGEDDAKCTCKGLEAEKKKCTCETCPLAPTCTCDYCKNGEPVEATSPTPAIDDTDVFPEMRLKLHLKLSDGTCKEMDIEEGDQFSGVIYKTSTNKTVFGHYKVLGFLYKGAGANVDITGLVLDDGDTVSSVALTDLKSLGSEDEVLSPDDIGTENGKKLSCLVSKYCQDSNVTSLSIPFATRTTEEIKFKKELELRGMNALVPANTGNRASAKIDEQTENVFEKKMSMEEEKASVSLVGLALTKEASVSYKTPTKLELINTKMVGLTSTNDIQFTNSEKDGFDNTCLATVEGCYFGCNECKKDEDGTENKVYNGINLRFKAADGTRIASNEFVKGCCKHNCVNIYDMEDNAVITIENNHFPVADDAIRIAAKSAPKNVTININNNTYDETTNEWGLVTIQPMDKEDMSGLTININNTDLIKDERVFRFYVPQNNTDYKDGHKLPHVYVNGVEQTVEVTTDNTSS